MKRTVNIRAIVACFAFILFLAVALYAGIEQVWPLFMGAVALTAISAAYALVVGEWWRTTRGDDSVRPGRM
ncbi:hypothetical protein [Sphaerisporangium fuscum]|uniref:hypothetical protein n=1 Tax=Sphaerisporangium fuscum TaxID=2835868 RepID=UPI001BDC1B8A|nr:hypothetical protein [Sphaerisporangium fuscum]